MYDVLRILYIFTFISNFRFRSSLSIRNEIKKCSEYSIVLNIYVLCFANIDRFGENH